MAVGDGIRRNITAISDDERDRFVYAIQQLDVLEIYSGKTYWDLQEDTHKAAHVAGAGRKLRQRSAESQGQRRGSTRSECRWLHLSIRR